MVNNGKRIVSVLIVIMLAAVMVLAGCGMDTSQLAGSASLTAADNQDEEALEDAVSEDAGQSTNEENKDFATDSAKYDSTEFLKDLPAWSGNYDEPYCEINNNKPDFSEEEIWKVTQESLDPLDELGRCGTANSCIGTDGMPTQPRGNISEVHPTGWHTDSYDGVEGGKLYNRCHLIAHKLSGDDAVPRNLITGTSYMNRQGMLPFEDAIYEYVKSTGNHVMYRVKPCFAGDELVARGVHMQAISVEDDGKGLAFNVFCYNVQPGIEIDYATGDNWLSGKAPGKKSGGSNSSQNAKELNAEENNATDQNATEQSNLTQIDDQSSTGEGKTVTVILNTNKSRKRIHIPGKHCAETIGANNKQEWTGTEQELIEFAKEYGYVACGSCDPDKELGIDLPTNK